MSRQYDAKQSVLKAYPDDKYNGVDLFYQIMDCDQSDFEYEEGMTAEEYIYGKHIPPASDFSPSKAQ